MQLDDALGHRENGQAWVVRTAWCTPEVSRCQTDFTIVWIQDQDDLDLAKYSQRRSYLLVDAAQSPTRLEAATNARR